jgi:hypothetical protein
LAVELFLAEFADVAVGVVFLRQEDEGEALVVGQCFQRVFQGAPGGLAAGVVAVEAEDDAVDLAQQLGDMGRVVAVPSVATALPTPFWAGR